MGGGMAEGGVKGLSSRAGGGSIGLGLLCNQTKRGEITQCFAWPDT
jgi:hypothetical protein